MLKNASGDQVMSKLNFLLVMPRFARNIGDSYGFPLGIAYVSSSMKKAGFNVMTLNLNHSEGTLYDILKSRIENDNVNVIMIGALSAQYSMIRPIVESAKQINRNIITIVGGGIITSDPIVALDALEYVDIGVIGEGEVTSVELCRALESKRDLATVDGLIFKANHRIFANNGDHSGGSKLEINGDYVITNRRIEIGDINVIPWPDYAGFELEKNLAANLGIVGFNESNTMAMISSRSCPYNCTFCFHTVGRKYRQRSLDGFFDELDYLVSNYKIRSMALSDELFARDISRLKEFCSRIKKYNIKWLGNFRVDDITPEMLPLLKEGNCVTMGFGLESADNRILESMRKGITIEQIERALKLVYDAGISISAGFIFGDIEETLETANNTLTWWKEHPEYGTSLRLITAFPGSHIYKYACEKGIIKDKVQFLRDGCPQLNISKMTDEEFQVFTKDLMQAVVSNAKLLSSYDVYRINDKDGCICLTGTCSVCGTNNNWENVRLFKPNFVACNKCGQQFNPPLNAAIRANIDTNMLGLLRKHGKLAVWGMTHHAIDIFSNSTVLRDANIFPIDICTSKQNKTLFGTQIYSPNIIANEGIETVVVTAPYHIGYIEAQIGTKYSSVQRVIDISNLVGTDYREDVK
jgi:anaerobic magnesium-protoporphyrin IX monomethyl ester cyclase